MRAWEFVLTLVWVPSLQVCWSTRTHQPHEVTMLLEKLSGDDWSAVGQLMTFLYDELRAMANTQ